jgi:hypothetical protein
MTTNDQVRLEQAQLLLNKTVEALKNCGFYSEVYLAGAVNLESEDGPGHPLVSTSTLDKLRLHYFLAECQAMVLQAELRKTEPRPEPEQALSA